MALKRRSLQKVMVATWPSMLRRTSRSLTSSLVDGADGADGAGIVGDVVMVLYALVLVKLFNLFNRVAYFLEYFIGVLTPGWCGSNNICRCSL